MKTTYFGRVMRSDVRAGTYIIVVAEGLKNANGEMLYDESAGVDAFGHKKLAGAGNLSGSSSKKDSRQTPRSSSS